MKTELKWGLLISVAAFIWTCLEYAVGLHTIHIDLHPIITMFWIPIAIFLLVLALREKKWKDLDGKMSYLDGVKSGVIIAVMLAVLSPVVLYIFFQFINPGFFDTMAAHAVEQGHLTQADATSYFSMGSYIFQAVLGSVIGTVVSTLIIMFFMRSK